MFAQQQQPQRVIEKDVSNNLVLSPVLVVIATLRPYNGLYSRQNFFVEQLINKLNLEGYIFILFNNNPRTYNF